MNFYYHNLNPIAFTLDGFPVTWYWLNYLISFFLISFVLLYLQRKGHTELSKNDVLDHLLVSWFGALLGARLGYVLIYNLAPFLQEPSLIYKFWLGGMSFHGALVGIIAANLIASRLKKTSFLGFTDLACLAAPIGLFTGRICNFINGELWGKPSDLPWAVVFPLADDQPRHPAQLYSAVGEGLLVFALMWALRHRMTQRGQLSALFLLSYGSVRFFLEFFREPDVQIGYLLGWISMGQILSLTMVTVGGVLYLYFTKRPYAYAKASPHKHR